MVDLRSVGLGVLCWPLLWGFFFCTTKSHNPSKVTGGGSGGYSSQRHFMLCIFFALSGSTVMVFIGTGNLRGSDHSQQRGPSAAAAGYGPHAGGQAPARTMPFCFSEERRHFFFSCSDIFFFVQPIPNKEKNHSSSFPASLWSSQGLPPAPTCNAAFIFEPFEGCFANIPAKPQHTNLPFKFDPVPMWVFFTHGCHRLVYRGRGRLPGSHAGLVAPNQAALQSHAAALGLAPQATVSRAIYPPPRKGPRLSGSGGRQCVGRGRGVGTPMPLEPLWDPRVDHPPFQGICRSTAIALRPRGEWGGITVHFSPFLAPKGDGSVF